MKLIRSATLALCALAVLLPASSAWAGVAPWIDETMGWDDMDRPDLMDVREPSFVNGLIPYYLFQGLYLVDSNTPLEWDAFSSDDQTSSRLSMWSAEEGTAAGYFTGSTGNLTFEETWNGVAYFTSSGGEVVERASRWFVPHMPSEWQGATVDWWIFEPDLVRRTPDRTLLLQRAYLGFEVAFGWHLGEGEVQPTESYITGVTYYGTIETCGAVVKVEDRTPTRYPGDADEENCADFAVWAVLCKRPIAEVLGDLRSGYHDHGVPGSPIEQGTLDQVLDLVGQDFASPKLVGIDRDHDCDPAHDQQWWQVGEGHLFERLLLPELRD